MRREKKIEKMDEKAEGEERSKFKFQYKLNL